MEEVKLSLPADDMILYMGSETILYLFFLMRRRCNLVARGEMGQRCLVYVEGEVTICVPMRIIP